MTACFRETVPQPTKTSFGSREFHAANLDEWLPTGHARPPYYSIRPASSLPLRPGRLAGGESFPDPDPGPGPGSGSGPDQISLQAGGRGLEKRDRREAGFRGGLSLLIEETTDLGPGVCDVEPGQ